MTLLGKRYAEREKEREREKGRRQGKTVLIEMDSIWKRRIKVERRRNGKRVRSFQLFSIKR